MFRILAIVLQVLAFSAVSHAQTENPRGTNLADLANGLCKSAFPQDEIEWATHCLVTALRARDINAIIALTENKLMVACGGCNNDFLFGDTPWVGAVTKKSLYSIVTADAELGQLFSDPIRLTSTESFIAVSFYSGWDPASEPEPEFTNENWMVDYFMCDFVFSERTGTWLITNGFCFTETEGPYYGPVG